MPQPLHDGQWIELTPILRDGEGYTPEFVWFCDKSMKYRGFFGDGDFGESIAINFAGRLMDYALSVDNVKRPILVLNYLVVHELSHWAEEEQQTDERHCDSWLRFLFPILIEIEVETEGRRRTPP